MDEKLTDTIQHAYDINIEDNFNEEGVVNLHLWCLDRKSHPVLIRIRDFPVLCHIELPGFIDGQPHEWEDWQVQRVFKYLQGALKDDKPSSYKFVQKFKLYYYRGERKYPMMLISFPTIKAMYHCQNFLKKAPHIHSIGEVHMKMWETSISVARKFFSLRNCRYSQWFTATGQEISTEHELRISASGTTARPLREYICKWNAIIPISQIDSAGWMTYPRIIAFDIETYTNNHRAMPNSLDAKHVVYLNSLIYQELGKPETIKKYITIMGECNDIEGVTVIRVTSEYGLVKAMADVIEELDPEIITGYNIFTYDNPYLGNRLGNRMNDWPHMGRLVRKETTMNTISWQSSGYGHNSISRVIMDGRISIDMLPMIRRDYKLELYDLNTVSMNFLGKGKHDIKAKTMFKIYERLEKATAAYKLPGGSDNEAVKTEYEAAKESMSDVARYCVQDSYLCVELFEKLNIWIGLVELSNIVGVTITELFTRGQSCRVVSQIYDLASRSGIVIDGREVIKQFFAGGLVGSPIPGLYKNILCFDFASLYPSIIISMNLDFFTLIPPDLVNTIPERCCNIAKITQEEPIDADSIKEKIDQEDEGKIEGAEEDEEDSDEEKDEEEEKKKKETKKTITRHYEYRFVKKEVREGILPQLCRRLVEERNVVRRVMKEHDLLVTRLKTLKGCMDESKTIDDLSQVVVYKKQQAEEEKAPEKQDMAKLFNWCIGETSKMIQEGATFSIAYDNIVAMIKDYSIRLIVGDRRQLGLKICSNSIYGFTGAQIGKLSCIEIAKSTTWYGRNLITQVIEHVEKKYGGISRYGDTDSCMIDLGITDPKQCQIMGDMIAEDVSGKPAVKDKDGNIIEPAVPGLFPPPLRIEYEKGMGKFIAFKKKKYAYTVIDKNGNVVIDKSGKPKVEKRGIVLSRRDTCRLLKKVYMDVLYDIFEDKPIESAFGILANMAGRLINGEIPPKDNLTIIKGLGSNYKNPNYFMKVFADELRSIGLQCSPGDRLEFVIVKTEDQQKGVEVPLGKRMRSLEMWTEAQGGVKEEKESGDAGCPYPAEEIDYQYYLEHALMNPLDQLFSVGYQEQLKAFEGIGFHPQNSRRHFTPISTPVQMIAKMIYDIMLGYKVYQQSEKEKLKHISVTVKYLAEWFPTQRKTIIPQDTPVNIVV